MAFGLPPRLPRFAAALRPARDLGEECGRCRLIRSFGQHEIKGIAAFVYRSIEICPAAFDLDVSLIYYPAGHPPKNGSRSLPGLGVCGDQRGIFHDPPVQGIMVDSDTSFRRDLHQIAIGNRISDIEKHRVQDDIFRMVAAFEVNRHVLILTCQFKGRRLSQLGKQAHISKSLRQNPLLSPT